MAKRVLVTGGSGRLGQALKALHPEWHTPPRSILDVCNAASIEHTLDEVQPDLVVHSAAYTHVAKAETERGLCWQTNVEGTTCLVRSLALRRVPLLHISTDYVFWGDQGNYHEDDPLGPVRNYYALSKLAAEAVVRVLPHHLVVRTSFRQRPWTYPVAFSDLFTSQDYLDRIAPQIAWAIERFEQIPYSTLHIAGPKRSAYELALESQPLVQAGSRQSAPVALPQDISLNTERWQQLMMQWGLAAT